MKNRPKKPGLPLDANDLQEIVAHCDDEGILLSWNKAGEDITGFAEEDVLGYHVDTIVAAESREDMHTLLGFERAGSTLPGMPMVLQTTFGMEVPVEVTLAPWTVGGSRKGNLFIFRDVTLKVQLQEQLDRMDILYRGLVEGSPDIVYVLDSKARLLFINDTVETLLGYTKKELMGRELIDIVHPEDRDHAYWPLRERRHADRATRSLRLRMLTKAGAPRRYDLDFVYISLSSYGLGPERAKASDLQREGALGTQGLARDVTELVLLQDFSRNVEVILPVCSVCHKIRATEGTREEWVALSDYVARKTGVMFSHTYCPDHLPKTE
jgi:PAS domain S-box-containing protein